MTRFASLHVTRMPCRSSGNVIHQVFCDLSLDLSISRNPVHVYTHYISLQRVIFQDERQLERSQTAKVTLAKDTDKR